MPSLRAKVCGAPGCVKVVSGENYCPACKAKKHREFQDTRAAQPYDSRWRRVAKAFRQRNPLCAMCAEKGIVREGNLVDHIVPVSAGGAMWDESNWQTLC